ncbi:hypothetical protein ABT237_15250, partial [Streptomyces sp. NPDC001581]|uniref:hypothetical protein n=1 Tax=Streptomyces sp. NPDC001581 TaxID=3154386 RepID=UPI0033165986
MTRSGQEPEKGPGGRPDKGPDEEGASLPVLLEAVLSVGSELELHSTLQHIVDSMERTGGGLDAGERARTIRSHGSILSGAGAGSG